MPLNMLMKKRNTSDILSKKYDFLIIGAGLYGTVMARELTDHGYAVLVIEKRDHVGGACYTESEEGITVHKYGPHIFHTDNEAVWEYVNRFADFKEFVNRPVAVYKGERYSLPFNMKTFEKMWGVSDSESARRIIQSQSGSCRTESVDAVSLEDQAIQMVGTEVYRKLIQGYSEKQWGRSCSELPSSFIKRLPVRFDCNDSYYDDKYQAVPEGGYTHMIERMLGGIEVVMGVDYYDPAVRLCFDCLADKIICSASIDAYYGYRYGRLEFRSVKFEEEKIEGIRYYQDRAVINYTDADTPFTRVTEHKHFDPHSDASYRYVTVITREFPCDHDENNDPFYPLADDKSMAIYEKYKRLAASDERVHFGGRMGSFRYYDMDDAIEAALRDAEMLAKKNDL